MIVKICGRYPTGIRSNEGIGHANHDSAVGGTIIPQTGGVLECIAAQGVPICVGAQQSVANIRSARPILNGGGDGKVYGPQPLIVIHDRGHGRRRHAARGRTIEIRRNTPEVGYRSADPIRINQRVGIGRPANGGAQAGPSGATLILPLVRRSRNGGGRAVIINGWFWNISTLVGCA